MNGIMQLNQHDVRTNPTFGAHDPSMMWDPVTKKYYSYATDVYMPDFGLTDKIGIPVRSSEDLVHFHYEGTVLSSASITEGRDNGDFPDTVNFWAPYVEYVYGEYRMFYSATKAFGSSESRIWLAVAKHPLGPFENRGVVADTWDTTDREPNAIDAHIVWEDSRCYLVYGSFFGGIYMKELDARTGLPLDDNPRTLGTCIARKNPEGKIDGPEGASVIYAKETGYFYLFLSYGWLGDNYDIRVGRSRTVVGPYLDWEGKNLKEESMGLKLANSYCFRTCSEHAYQAASTEGWTYAGLRGPGHGVPFYDPKTGGYFFVHHIRDGAKTLRSYDEKESRYSYHMHYMMIRPMFFVHGWPVLGPEPYDGKSLTAIRPEAGVYEVIRLDDESNDIKYAKDVRLAADDPCLMEAVNYRSIDAEQNTDTIVCTGIDACGVAYWGKKKEE